MLNVAKVQYKLRVASGLNLPWYVSMKRNMEANFSMEWNMEWKIFRMEWKWNGRKLPVWNMEKTSSIPFHIMPCLEVTFYSLILFQNKNKFKCTNEAAIGKSLEITNSIN